jgi:hypothetical protein
MLLMYVFYKQRNVTGITKKKHPNKISALKTYSILIKL